MLRLLRDWKRHLVKAKVEFDRVWGKIVEFFRVWAKSIRVGPFKGGVAWAPKCKPRPKLISSPQLVLEFRVKFKPKTSVVQSAILLGEGAGPFSPGGVSSWSKQCFDTLELSSKVVLATVAMSSSVWRAGMSPVRTDDVDVTLLLSLDAYSRESRQSTPRVLYDLV
jgi:hypothetical protein